MLRESDTWHAVARENGEVCSYTMMNAGVEVWGALSQTHGVLRESDTRLAIARENGKIPFAEKQSRNDSLHTPYFTTSPYISRLGYQLSRAYGYL